MFRYATHLAPLASLCCATETGVAAQETTAPTPTTHQEFIPALLELLQQTEQSLATCTDEASTKAALPRLRELAAQARKLSAVQQSLPEPTVQDYMAAHPHVAEFNKLWDAICEHLSRLEQARLVSPELRQLLQLDPREGKR